MTWKSKDLTEKEFGNFKIIGDTGKRNKDGNKIYVARNVKTGEIKEGVSRLFIKGELTGYLGSEKHRKTSGVSIRKTRLNLDEKQEIKRTIKAKITSYKRSKGYHYDKSRQKWAACITIGRRKKYLGRYANEEDAIEARQKAVNEQIKKLENEMERI